MRLCPFLDVRYAIGVPLCSIIIENRIKRKVSCTSRGNLVQYPMESDVTMHIVMVEPEIPGNTGNIARLCAANHITLHLVKPLGFSLEDKYLKRAGLDYWPLVDVQVHENFAEVQEKYKGHHFYFLTTKSEQCYADIRFTQDDLLVFGKETKGLPESLLKQYPQQCFRIPMVDKARSLNLSNSVAIVSYEAMRQLGFPDMAKSGIGIHNLK